ncbi:SCO family protein [Evansella cellulosilytica]|uniref:Electron transport protein SCO1/SenC n=1 Tax=Evansella cellulosilytica (strain ATCC 21833 / DSM 2522 / FERM P-1141 / JCM 9156 / N-4) TaxID=649639 RepID=E6TR67_EVAC2|nr:SCO family protein [Evansella cellulosilytica]ADU30579.1 electron transport protein SCO1/SenC [Evansella cellulosilytica DSM 2522]
MKKIQRTTLSSIIVLLFGFTIFFIGTDGFKAFTAETARVNALIDAKPSFPQVTLEDSNGRTYTLSEFEGKYVFITFIYTSCGTVCPMMELNMRDVLHGIPSTYIGKDIIFLSISFDPERDDPETLDAYKDYFSADGELWRMARVNNAEELDALLETFGVIVIPDGSGDFSHNSAFYLVDQSGILIDVMDYTDVDTATKKLLDLLENETEEK